MTLNTLNKLSISFCIPAFRFDTLKDAIQSILNLTDIDGIEYEILISDDSQNDEIYNYIKLFNSKNIRYIKNISKGSCNNHNNLITNAKYEWVVMLHDDDFLYPRYIHDFLNNIEYIRSSDIVWGGRTVTNSKKVIIKSYKITNGGNLKIKSEDYLDALLGGSMDIASSTAPIMVSGLAVRKSLIINSKARFDPIIGLGTDMLYIYLLLLHSRHVYYINEVLSNYSYNENSERTEASNEGLVFYKSRQIIDIVLKEIFRLKSKRYYELCKKKYIYTFYQNSMNINGPILWTSLRYKGQYLKRLSVQFKLFHEILSNDSSLLFNVKTYIILIISILPQTILRWAHKFFLSNII